MLLHSLCDFQKWLISVCFSCRLAVFRNPVFNGSGIVFCKSHDVCCAIYCHSSVWIPMQVTFIADLGCYSMRLRLYSLYFMPCHVTQGVEYSKVLVAYAVHASCLRLTRTRIRSVFLPLVVGLPSVPRKSLYFLLFFQPRFVKSRLFSKIFNPHLLITFPNPEFVWLESCSSMVVLFFMSAWLNVSVRL